MNRSTSDYAKAADKVEKNLEAIRGLVEEIRDTAKELDLDFHLTASLGVISDALNDLYLWSGENFSVAEFVSFLRRRAEGEDAETENILEKISAMTENDEEFKKELEETQRLIDTYRRNTRYTPEEREKRIDT